MQYTPTEGLPNQFFQCRLNNAGTKAIVRADWINDEIANIGQYLGKLILPDGIVEENVLREVDKPEWQSIVE
jgi:5'(3')-deoxyribonucleotidase